MEKRDYTVSDIYQGGYSTFESPKASLYTTGSLSLTTDARTANILQEVSTKLSSGVKNIEIEGVSGEIFDSIPKQHMKEVNRLSKLTGIKVSIHAPVINVSGIDTRSGGYSEAERESAERRVAEALQRSHELDPQGNIPVNFHSAEGIPGSQLLPPSERKIIEEQIGISKEGKPIIETYEQKHKILLAVNKETGRVAPLQAEEKFYPGGPEGKIRPVAYTPEEELRILNHTEWSNALTQIEFNREHAERILRDTHRKYREMALSLLTDEGRKRAEELKLTEEEHAELKKIYSAQEYIKQAELSLNASFDRAYKYGTDEEKKALKKASENYSEILGVNEKGSLRKYDPKVKSEAIYNLLQTLQRIQPTINVPLEQFAVEKTSQTFGNAAFETYKKFKNKGEPSPILNIENPPAGFALSTGEDVKNLVEASRKKFVERAVKEGISEGQAKKEAEKLIGATLDLGHMNMLRKYGYSEKEIVKEAEKVAPLLKHLHLSDNFGFEHTELPMGMGNVPTKEIMQKVEAKLGKKKTDELRKVIEAAAWWQHMKTPPLVPTLELSGSSMYRTGGPYWNQAPGLYQDYSSGFGQLLPQINYETFGSGFSQLPAELGGQRPGGQGGRMSGRPME